MQDAFEPNIVCFCCHWCSYAAADLAGSMRLQYATNIRIIKIPCTGRLAIIHMLRAVEKGADGVLISGCLLGDCHYRSGNNHAVKRVEFVKNLLGEIGLDSGRLEMYFNSSAMGPQFAQCCNEFTERIRKLGPAVNRFAAVAEG